MVIIGPPARLVKVALPSRESRDKCGDLFFVGLGYGYYCAR